MILKYKFVSNDNLNLTNSNIKFTLIIINKITNAYKKNMLKTFT